MKNIYFTMFAAAMLLAGCTTDEIGDADPVSDSRTVTVKMVADETTRTTFDDTRKKLV